MNGASGAGKNLRFALRVAGLLLKGFSLLFFFLLVLVVAAGVALPSLMHAQRVRAALVAQLTQILERPVEIDGVVLTPQGIKLRGVKIAEKDDPSRRLIESDIAVVTIKLMPLLRRRLELNNVRLVSPRIRLVRDEQGRWNFADLFAAASAPRSAPIGRFSLPVSLAAGRTVIEGGRLTIEDRLRNRSAVVDRFNLAVHRFDVDEPFAFSASFDNTSRLGDRRISASLALEGSMSLASFNWPEAYLRAKSLTLKIDGNLIRGSVGVRGFPQSTIDAELSLPALGPAQWAAYFGKTPDLALPPSRWRAKVEFVQPRLIRVERLQAEALSLSLTASGVVDLTRDKPRLHASLILGEFPLDQASSYRGSLSRYELKGRIAGQASLSGWFDHLVVHNTKLSLRAVSAAFTRQKVEDGDMDFSAWEDFTRLSVSVSRGRVSAFANAFSDITLSASLVKEDLKIENLFLKWGDSRLKLKARVVNLPAPKEVSISGNLNSLRWEKAQELVAGILASVSTRAVAAAENGGEEAPRKPWVQTFKYVIPRKFPDTVGHIRIGEVAHKNFSFRDTDLLWDIRGVTPSLKKVSGDVRVGFGPGRVEDIQAVQSAHKFLRIVFLPYIYMHKMNNLSVLSAATAYPKTLDFNRIEGEYGIARGEVTTRCFHVDSPQLIAYADGAADFGKETVDMNILTRLTSYRAPLPEWWVDEAGRPAIAFHVMGDLNKPDLEPRLSKMASGEIEKAVSECGGRTKARFEAIEKLQTL